MADTMSKELRSAVMRKIRSKNTHLEVAVRKVLWNKGVRYRLHGKIFGTPDIVCHAPRVAIFVDSCFWHGCKQHLRMPSSNKRYWSKKIRRNIERRKQVNQTLRSEGWRVVRLWEHNLIGNLEQQAERIRAIVAERRQSLEEATSA